MKNKLLNLLFEPNMENYIFELSKNKMDPKTFIFYYHIVFLRSARKREKMEEFTNYVLSILSNKIWA